ncbi:RNA 2',3'-cyclic phosphodiesterase [Martelella alba]|uniref:RNA 2',3'-cyclic phosphodiesterase n=1 Tax=Martelella alba TaxID=2590451 RepID=A0ABY2SRT4_9HYPH|nr:RNA 2',3'-cyclic phosphodiesterase [Martelella alba]TKI08803.1 RNA 2',3'-cyclic phosphodiesterase [Martelella alba]
MTATRRLFFAIALPDDLRRRIVAWRAGHFPPDVGRPVAAENLHLTLAFLGEVAAGKEQALRAAAGRLRQPGFDITLDDCGHWPRPGVVWLGLRRPPAGLVRLAQWLRDRAARNGCYQSPTPFHPHITLWRQAFSTIALPPAGPGWRTEAHTFHLYQSVYVNGRHRYLALESWPLTPDA